MPISPKDIQKACQLANLPLNKNNQETLEKDISDILDYVETLKGQNTDGVRPLFHPFDLHQRLRSDVATEQSLEEEYAAMAPLFENGHFLVPTVIDES